MLRFRGRGGAGGPSDGKGNKELQKLLNDINLGAVRTPISLRDPGFGITLESYDVIPNLISMRIAEVIQESEGDSGERSVEYWIYASEPPLSQIDEAVYVRALERIFELMDPEKVLKKFDPGSFFRENIDASFKELGLKPSSEQVVKLQYFLVRDVLGHSLLEPFMRDPNIEDIKVMRPGLPALVVHRKYSALGWLQTNAVFHDKRQLDELILRFARMGRRSISPAQPLADFTTEAGVRMAAALGDVTRHGSALSIRKFPERPISVTELIRQNVLSPLMAAYMWYIIEKKFLFFIAGPTGSGKTTLLNALLGLISPFETFHTIEEVFEISPHTPRYLGFTVRRGVEASSAEVGIPDLLNVNLRMRPDHLIVGEVRTSRDLTTFLNVAGTGHSGVATIHAHNPDYLLMRLRTMGIDPASAEKLWGCAITLPAVRSGNMLMRKVVTVADFVPREAGVVPVEVMKFLPEQDAFFPNDVEELFRSSPRLQDYAAYTRVSEDHVIREIAEKEAILEGMIRERISEFFDVAKKVAALRAVERYEV